MIIKLTPSYNAAGTDFKKDNVTITSNLAVIKIHDSSISVF